MAGNGVCEIRKEFVLTERSRVIVPKISDDIQVIENKQELTSNEDPVIDGCPPAKKIKINTEDEVKATDADKPIERRPKQKPRGQNKGRPKPLREALERRPCPTIVNVTEGSVPKQCQYNGCKFIHDPLEFLKIKPSDIVNDDGKCYVFEMKGECPWGISCRYGSSHISTDGKNIIDSEKLSKWTGHKLNSVSYDVLSKLQKRKYDLKKAENMVDDMKKERLNKVLSEKSTSNTKDKNQEKNGTEETKSTENTNKDLSGEKILSTSGAVTDEDIIALQSNEKKQIDWKNKLYLGPLTTLGNLPFRRICKEFGADITCGEMALCDSLLKGTTQEWALVKRHETEDVFGVQICGSNPYAIAKTALVLQKEITVDFIDLNLGCPIDLVYKRGGGCGLLLRANSLESSIRCASQILSIPFTIKTRTGVYQDTKIAHHLAPKFADWGVSMMTIHGRSREQRYTKNADWEYVNACAQAASPCPVYGNGDILSYDDYKNSREIAPNVSGVMIGRGALIKPWIFTEIKEQKLWDIRSSERFDILKKFTNYGLEHWGSDTKGVENTRRFLLEWLSFLHRYVPVGLLERPPQRINERPPYYRGRDDLETLMASSNCSDWVKISEMLVGPVPNDFLFLPKHKANSYQ